MPFYNVKKLDYLLKQDCSVVITGDSLAYNRYDFVEESRMNAWDCPFGMKSWSFLLRDYLISHSNGWIPASKMEILAPGRNFSSFLEYNTRVPLTSQLPLEQWGVIISTTSPTDIIIQGCPENICFITNPSRGALYDFNGKLIELIGKEEIHSGYYFKYVNINSGFLKSKNPGKEIMIAGASENKTEVFLTGSGSKTAEWMLENIEDRILQYKPKLCILIIGANNRRMNDPKSFKAALNRIISEIIGTGSELILLSPPHSSTTDPVVDKNFIYSPDEKVTKPIMDILKQSAEQYDIPYVNLFEFFNNIPDSIWRFDNTHFTKKGNLMLYEALVNNFFGRN